MSNIMKAFIAIHGDINRSSSSCYTEIELEDVTDEELAVHVMKEGNLCWSATRESLALELAVMNYENAKNCKCSNKVK